MKMYEIRVRLDERIGHNIFFILVLTVYLCADFGNNDHIYDGKYKCVVSI